MKILIVCDKAWYEKNTNPFCRILLESLAKYGHDVEYGLDYFWNSFKSFDVIYMQWPEMIYGWRKVKMSEADHLEQHLNEIKSSGIKIITTCHNLHPHNNDEVYARMYKIIYDQSDAIHHLGSYSYNLFCNIYPTKLNFVAPHPIFYDCRKKGSQQTVARKMLKIPDDKICILSFGMFRNDSEQNLIYSIVQHFPKVICLCPRFIKGGLSKFKWYKDIAYAYNMFKVRKQGIYANWTFVPEDKIPNYFNAADIVLIQRKEILNSGNLPLGFSAGKIVVGPRKGNVGAILQETGNPTFDPEDKASLINAVRQAILLLKENNVVGEKNYQKAITEWTPDSVGAIINDNIKKLGNI